MITTSRAAALSLIVGISLGALSATTHAEPIEWTLNNIVFDDGGTATGTFVYDAATNDLSDINIQTSDGFVFSGNTYSSTLGVLPVKIALTTATNFGDLSNELILDLLFIGDGLTDAGGTVAVGDTVNGSSVESFCIDVTCGNQDPQRFILPGGTVTTEAITTDVVSIDFENFQVGDRIAEINSVTAGLGATFDEGSPQQGAQLEIITDPNDATNQVAASPTNAAEADILVNFSSPVDLVRVTFPDNPEANGISISLCAANVTGTAQGDPCDGNNVVDFAGGTEPAVLAVSAPDIRSISLESSSGGIIFDNIEFRAESITVPAETCTDPGGCDLGGQILELPDGIETEGITINREVEVETDPGDDGQNTTVLADGRLFLPPQFRSSSPIAVLEIESDLVVSEGTILVTIEPGDFLEDPLPCDTPIPVGVDPQQQDIVVWQTTDASEILEGRALEVTSDCGGSSRGRVRSLSFFVVGLRLDCGVDWFVDPDASEKVRQCFSDLTATKFHGLLQAVLRSKDVVPRRQFRRLLALTVFSKFAFHFGYYGSAERNLNRLLNRLEKTDFEPSEFNHSGNIEMRASNVRFMIQKIRNIIANQG